MLLHSLASTYVRRPFPFPFPFPLNHNNLHCSTASRRIPVASMSTQTEVDYYYFGPYKIPFNEVFLTTECCYAFVNLRPVVPDVLVSTKRLVPRFTDLTDEEATDLWLTAKRIGSKIEPYFKASSLTLAIQDGAEAGQTVPHVHVHILPRKVSDFKKMDDVYDELDKKEKELAEKLDIDIDRKDRPREEMAAEAKELRALFEN